METMLRVEIARSLVPALSEPQYPGASQWVDWLILAAEIQNLERLSSVFGKQGAHPRRVPLFYIKLSIVVVVLQ